jgi:hypothetical protein
LRTIQTPYASFQRVSTSPTVYSLGNPTLKDCGGSKSTFGNRKRVLATRPDVQAAENATHPTVVHLRKPRRETLSASAGLAAAAGAGAAGAGFAAAGTFGSAGATPAARGGAGSVTPLAAFDRGAAAACTPPGAVAAVMGGVGTGGVEPAAVPAG